MKNRFSAWIVLGVITIVAGLGLAITNEVTKGPIAQQSIAAEEKAKQAVMPEAATFEEIPLEDGTTLFAAKAENGDVVGYVGKEEAKGYGGMIEVITGVKPDGTITGINVGGASFAETPGLGAKARESAFMDQFAGKMSPVKLGDSSQDNAVDSITAATRTSNAVLSGVNAIAKKVKLYLNPDADKPMGVAEGTPYAGEAVGFAGAGNPVYVVVTVKDDGTISGLTVGDERFAETEGYGAAALETDFTNQFIGKPLPLAMDAVDGISGATMTTKAVVDAVNQAYESGNVLLPEGTTYAGDAAGFAGDKNPVHVEVTVKDDGTISALKIGDERFAETEGYGASALAPEFASQFIGKAMPVTADMIEAISGATVTTTAVIDAINSAYENKNIIAAGTTPKPTAEPTATPEPIAVPETAATASKEGFAGLVAVTVNFSGDGRIDFLSIGDKDFKETKGFGYAALDKAFQDQFLGKLPPLAARKADQAVTDSNIDGITGATVTTNAVLDAVNELHLAQFPQIQSTQEPVVQVSGSEVTVSKQGFMGTVAVTVIFAEDGSIASASISPEGFAETPGYGAKAMEETYLAQFAGKRPPLRVRQPGEAEGADVVNKLFQADTVTSATVTTQAIVDAINEAHTNFLSQSGQPVSKQGFMGQIVVETAFQEDGRVKEVKILKDGFMETPGYGDLALAEGFADRFVGKLPPLSIKKPGDEASEHLVDNLLNPDTQTSASVTLQAIIDAINEAYESRP